MRVPVGVLALVLALTVACATRTKLSNVWKAEADLPAVRKVLVVGIAPSESGRRAYEDAFAAALAARGADAVTSYRQIPAEQGLSEASVRSAVRGRDFEGVLVTRLLGVEEDTEYVPPTAYVTPGYYGYGLYGYMGGGVSYSPGYTVRHTTVRLETHLYDARTARLLWAAHSDTFDPDSTDDVIRSVTDKLSERLAADGLLPDA